MSNRALREGTGPPFLPGPEPSIPEVRKRLIPGLDGLQAEAVDSRALCQRRLVEALEVLFEETMSAPTNDQPQLDHR